MIVKHKATTVVNGRIPAKCIDANTRMINGGLYYVENVNGDATLYDVYRTETSKEHLGQYFKRRFEVQQKSAITKSLAIK